MNRYSYSSKSCFPQCWTKDIRDITSMYVFSNFLGLVYTSSYCRTKPIIIKSGNGTGRNVDLYVEPVSNSIDLIMIYGTNIHAKFWREICEEKQDCTYARTWGAGGGGTPYFGDMILAFFNIAIFG